MDQPLAGTVSEIVCRSFEIHLCQGPRHLEAGAPGCVLVLDAPFAARGEKDPQVVDQPSFFTDDEFWIVSAERVFRPDAIDGSWSWRESKPQTGFHCAEVKLVLLAAGLAVSPASQVIQSALPP